LSGKATRCFALLSMTGYSTGQRLGGTGWGFTPSSPTQSSAHSYLSFWA